MGRSQLSQESTKDREKHTVQGSENGSYETEGRNHYYVYTPGIISRNVASAEHKNGSNATEHTANHTADQSKFQYSAEC